MAEDRGDFKVEYSGSRNQKYSRFDRIFRENRSLEIVAEKLNRSLMLPRNIAIRVRSCDQINAFYDPSDHTISVCLELAEYFFELYKLDGDTDRRANMRTSKAVTFVLLHEVGHALIDNYDLPITGNEEDAADSCSSFICIRYFGEEGVESIIAAAEAFAIAPDLRKQDQHVLNEARFINSLCMIYGSEPSRHAGLKNDILLSGARAARCPSEFERAAKSWENLMRRWSTDWN